jgi:hypothetical protein
LRRTRGFTGTGPNSQQKKEQAYIKAPNKICQVTPALWKFIHGCLPNPNVPLTLDQSLFIDSIEDPAVDTKRESGSFLPVSKIAPIKFNPRSKLPKTNGLSFCRMDSAW